MAGGLSPQAGFVGTRLRIARTFRGLGHAELGEHLGIRGMLLGQLEAGARLPEPELVAALAAELGFTRAFFAAPLADEVRDEECHGPTGPARRRALAHAALLAELVAWLDERVSLPEENLPDDVSTADPGAIEAAAAACRHLWGLAPDLPVPNLTRVIERAGVVVARVDGAASLARAGRRLLVVIDAAPSTPSRTEDDARLALARAAGHVVLHRGADASPSLEAEADQFASALLLPREGLLRELPRAPSLDGEALTALARRWNVSLGALVRRAAELPIANAARYRDAVPHVTLTGRPAELRRWSEASETSEAPDAPEAPEVLALALDELARGRRVARAEVTRRLGWPRSIFTAVTGLTLGDERGNRVVSLSAWKARRTGAPPALRGGAAQPSGAQLELDFGVER